MKLTGTAYWAKITSPVDNFGKTGKEYTMDVVLDPDSEKMFVETFGKKKLKAAVNSKGVEHVGKAPYVEFVKPTATGAGKPIKPPSIVDAKGRDWDMDDLVGNGSKVSLIVGIREGDFNGTPWKKPNLQKIRIDEHVPYGDNEDFDDYDDDFKETDSTGEASDEEGWEA